MHPSAWCLGGMEVQFRTLSGGGLYTHAGTRVNMGPEQTKPTQHLV